MASEGKTFSNDHEFASEQGQKGGATQPEEVYKRESTCAFRGCLPSSSQPSLILLVPSVASEHDGLRKDGQPDKRMSSEHGKFSLFRHSFLASIVADFFPSTDRLRR